MITMSDSHITRASSESECAIVELDSGESVAYDAETDTYLFRGPEDGEVRVEGEKREIAGETYRAVSEQYVKKLDSDLLKVLNARDPAERLFELEVPARRRPSS